LKDQGHKIFVTCLLLFLCSIFCKAQPGTIKIKGIVVEKDSVSPVSFAYVVSRGRDAGVVADGNGKFELAVNEKDTILCSYFGYIPLKIAVKDALKKKTAKGLMLVLYKKVVKLPEVEIFPRQLTKNEKDYYERFLNAPQADIRSPFTFLYDRFSGEARQRDKLRELYSEALLNEAYEARIKIYLDKIRAIYTQDDIENLVKYCSLTPDLIQADDYTFYSTMERCYGQYKKRGKDGDYAR
jgi:hypothetical protein